MRNHPTIDVEQANLLELPAVKAWAKLSTTRMEPMRVVILKPEDKTSSVYRLGGLGPSRSAVIAKPNRIRSGALALEIYRVIFPQLGLGTLYVLVFTCHF